MIKSYQKHIYGAFLDAGDGQPVGQINAVSAGALAIFADDSGALVVDPFLMW